MAKPIYLDNNATTPVDSRVLDAMYPYFGRDFGNASSDHLYGEEADRAVDKARAQVAALASADPQSVYFTSGATEANNIAIIGRVIAKGGRGHIITSPIEHSSVLRSLDVVNAMGGSHSFVPVSPEGLVDPEDVRREIVNQPDTVLVSIMSANNEIGTVQPIREIAAVCRELGVVFHTDACQGFGRVAMEVCELDPANTRRCRPIADMVSLSGHKLYGPKGVGAFIVADDVDVSAVQMGGSQERGLRPGTLNVTGIVGLGKACELMASDWPADAERLMALRDRMVQTFVRELGEDVVRINGPLDVARRLPHNLHMTLLGVCPVRLGQLLRDKVAYSAGSACMSDKAKKGHISHVLQAIGGVPPEKGASVRLGLGRFTTETEVLDATDAIIDAAKTLKGIPCPPRKSRGDSRQRPGDGERAPR